MEKKRVKEEVETKYERYNRILAGIYIGAMYVSNPNYKVMKRF